MQTRGLRLSSALLAVLAVAGCGTDPTDTVADAAPVLTAEATQTREDAAAGRRFQVLVENTGSMPFTVTSVQLLSGGFTAEPPARQDSAFAPGRQVSLPAPYGPVRCQDPVEPVEVAIGLLMEGQETTQRVPLRSDSALLERIHAKECAGLALAERVGLVLDDGLAVVDAGGEPGLRGTLTLTRTAAAGPVALSGTRGSVLYDVELPDGPASLLPEQTSIQVPIVLTSRTCEGHAIGEAKQPYVFLAFLQVGTGEQASARIPVTSDQQTRLLGLLDEACPRAAGPL